MKIDIYKSANSGHKYLSVPEGTDLTKLNLPADFLPLSPFKTGQELDPNRQRTALDQGDVIRQIEEKGFAVHGAKVETTVGTV